MSDSADHQDAKTWRNLSLMGALIGVFGVVIFFGAQMIAG